MGKGGEANEEDKPTNKPLVRESSGVTFSNINGKYWRIGNKYYDLTPWLDKHPGGRQVLELARDRFDDCTYVFEAYHPNFVKARLILKKFEVVGVLPPKTDTKYPDLCAADSFYSVLRLKVAKYLKANGGPGPKPECLQLWWVVIALWFMGFGMVAYTGSFVFAILNGIVGAWVGGFGHNWVHQPNYRLYGYSLDLLGYSSEGWIREHNLQHHMYTNTPLDNHFDGTAPFLVPDPRKNRMWFQKWIMAFINPLLLFFGTEANWIAHLVEMVRGNENVTIGKLFIPIELYIISANWGFARAFFLWVVMAGTVSVYYFTLALMNHNTEAAWDVNARNQAQDWGAQQLSTCADIDVGLTFHQSIRYLWLNYHTVHHLFPHTDMSHHPAIQQLMIETTKEFKIKYECGFPAKMWWEMVQSFHSPRHLGSEIVVYP